MGQLVGQDFDAAFPAITLGTLILFLSPCRMMHAWDWRSTCWSTFCTSADSGVLSVRSNIAPILVRQANVEYISTRPPSFQPIIYIIRPSLASSIVVMHA